MSAFNQDLEELTKSILPSLHLDTDNGGADNSGAVDSSDRL